MSTQDQAIIDELERLEGRRAQAYVEGDGAVLEELLADDCVVLHGSGIVEGKGPFIPSFLERLEIRGVERRDVVHRVRGDVVIVTGVQTMEVRRRSLGPGAEFHSSVANFTVVWEKREGRWQVIVQHNTRVPQGS